MKIKQIIHDDRAMMIPMFVKCGILKCDVKLCNNKPTAIVFFENNFVVGCCEEHYQQGINGKELVFSFEQHERGK